MKYARRMLIDGIISIGFIRKSREDYAHFPNVEGMRIISWWKFPEHMIVQM